jgi:S-adenosylhomocysteine hydrolase
LRILHGCLNREARALEHAGHLTARCGDGAVPVGLESAAAWDTFARALVELDDAITNDFVLQRTAAYFARPALLKAVHRRYPVPRNSPLAGADVLACRHLLASTVAELDTIQESVPDLRLAEVVGKPYSANWLAVLALQARKIDVRHESCDMPALDVLDFGLFAKRHKTIVASVVDAYVRRVRKSPAEGRPLLVIDDGGALINAVWQRVAAGELTCPVVAIEQTTHGMFAMPKVTSDRAARNGFAYIAVADSRSKLADESGLIARSVIDKTDEWLRLLGHLGFVKPGSSLTSLRIGLIGFGPVGATIASRLPPGASLQVYDRNPRKLVLAELQGLRVAWSPEELLRESELVIAASGGTSVDAELAEWLRDGTILVSASSGDLEFSDIGTAKGWTVRAEATLRHNGMVAFDRTHGLLVAEKDDRTIYIVNRGFPVNFDGSHDPIPADDIQLTRALIVGAVLQAAGATGESSVGSVGRQDLDLSIDRFISEEYRKLHAVAANGGPEPRGARTTKE